MVRRKKKSIATAASTAGCICIAPSHTFPGLLKQEIFIDEYMR